MSIAQFPSPESIESFYTSIPASTIPYEHRAFFKKGVWKITGVPVIATFVNEGGVITTQTSSGTLTFSLTEDSTRVYLTGTSSAGAITIERVSLEIFPASVGNGTLDIINSTGTYNETGFLAVLLLGGGEAGNPGTAVNNYNQWNGGGGGAAGAIKAGVLYTDTPTTVTVGAGGTPTQFTPNAVAALSATNSSFGNLLTVNSSGALTITNANGGGSFPGQVGNATSNSVWWGNQTTGSGGGGFRENSGSRFGNIGGGSGIGTGGTGALGPSISVGGSFEATNNATPGTGKGSGGGGGGAVGSNLANNSTKRQGAAGAPGAVYVLRGW